LFATRVREAEAGDVDVVVFLGHDLVEKSHFSPVSNFDLSSNVAARDCVGSQGRSYLFLGYDCKKQNLPPFAGST
jgi:hypothetical protein